MCFHVESHREVSLRCIRSLKEEAYKFNARMRDAGASDHAKVRAFNEFLGEFEKAFEEDNAFALATYLIFDAEIELRKVNAGNLDKLDEILSNLNRVGIVTTHEGCF